MNKDIAELLAAEAEEAERHAGEEDHGPSYPRRHPPRDPAQVYSLRIPAGRLDELRRLADVKGVTPSALMRQWVLERLAAEEAGVPDPAQVWERLREVLGGLEGARERLRQGHAPEPSPVPQVSLDPQEEEHQDIRELITDRVVERMEDEIAQWRQERASARR